MEQLKQKIVNDINEAKMPLDVVYYLIKDMFRDLEAQFYETYVQPKENKKQEIEEESEIKNTTKEG